MLLDVAGRFGSEGVGWAQDVRSGNGPVLVIRPLILLS